MLGMHVQTIGAAIDLRHSDFHKEDQLGIQSAALDSLLWEESRRTDTRQRMLLLKRVLMAKLAAAGVELLGEPRIRAIDREIVREEFFLQTPADGTERQKQNFRHRRFIRALDRAIEKQLVECREFGSIAYLWLLPQQPQQPEQPDPGDEF
jgi:hypothetical protein